MVEDKIKQEPVPKDPRLEDIMKRILMRPDKGLLTDSERPYGQHKKEYNK
ncbi:hypothetical protein GOV06_03335 [Candidatus Woesearchaeota archaeon]|nr:hypothetical protein [Candidatus Woesearchaeota archaeon]